MRTFPAVTAILAAGAFAAAPSASASANHHWCRQGDPPIAASAGTDCAFAGNVVTDYVNVCHASRTCDMQVASQAAGKRYRITCLRTGARYTGTVTCTGTRGTGIWARFTSDI